MKKWIIIKLTALFFVLFILIGTMLTILKMGGNSLNIPSVYPNDIIQGETFYPEEVFYDGDIMYDYSTESPDKPYNIGNGFVDSKGIKNIFVDWINGNIDIVETDDTAIGISENSHLNDKSLQLRYETVGDSLNIKYSVVGYADQYDNGKKLTLSIPENIDNKLQIKLKAYRSDISVSKLKADDLQLNVLNGSIVLNNCKINKYYSISSEGSVYINSHIPNITVYIGNGYIDCRFNKAAQNVDLKAEDGEISVHLPNDIPGFLLKANADSVGYGLFDCKRKNNGMISYGDESLYIKASVGRGEINIYNEDSDK